MIRFRCKDLWIPGLPVMSLAQLQPFQQLNCLRAAISKGELYSWMCYALLLWNLEVAPNWVYVEWKWKRAWGWRTPSTEILQQVNCTTVDTLFKHVDIWHSPDNKKYHVCPMPPIFWSMIRVSKNLWLPVTHWATLSLRPRFKSHNSFYFKSHHASCHFIISSKIPWHVMAPF